MKREYMIRYREGRGWTYGEMAKKCLCSTRLIQMLENDDTCVTHPRIVKRIRMVYPLTPEQTEMMLPECRRKKGKAHGKML